jgi:protein-S-isoprenylcysteine O-methyltransferase Ste14
MSARTLIFTINFVVLLGSCWLGFESLKLGFLSTAVSFVAAGLAVACVGAAAVLHSRFPKKHTEAADFPNLMTTGPYGYVRHPFYSTVIVLNYAVSFAVLSYYAIIASTLMLPLWWYLVKTEEMDLVNVWGQKYIDYKKNVPMLIPKLQRKRKTSKT